MYTERKAHIGNVGPAMQKTRGDIVDNEGRHAAHNTIYPTLECFDDALDFIADVLRANPDDVPELTRSLKLVHGILLAPDGTRYAHAWVEDDRTGRCIFRGIHQGEAQYYGVPRAEYYTDMRVQARTRYSLRAAARHNRRSGTYGPWLPHYLALCTPRKEAP